MGAKTVIQKDSIRRWRLAFGVALYTFFTWGAYQNSHKKIRVFMDKQGLYPMAGLEFFIYQLYCIVSCLISWGGGITSCLISLGEVPFTAGWFSSLPIAAWVGLLIALFFMLVLTQHINRHVFNMGTDSGLLQLVTTTLLNIFVFTAYIFIIPSFITQYLSYTLLPMLSVPAGIAVHVGICMLLFVILLLCLHIVRFFMAAFFIQKNLGDVFSLGTHSTYFPLHWVPLKTTIPLHAHELCDSCIDHMTNSLYLSPKGKKHLQLVESYFDQMRVEEAFDASGHGVSYAQLKQHDMLTPFQTLLYDKKGFCACFLKAHYKLERVAKSQLYASTYPFWRDLDIQWEGWDHPLCFFPRSVLVRILTLFLDEELYNVRALRQLYDDLTPEKKQALCLPPIQLNWRSREAMPLGIPLTMCLLVMLLRVLAREIVEGLFVPPLIKASCLGTDTIRIIMGTYTFSQQIVRQAPDSERCTKKPNCAMP